MRKKINGGGIMDIKNNIVAPMIGLFFRYIPLIALYIVCLVFIFNNSTQYILFICLLVLSIFGTIFIIRDIFSIEKIYTCIFGVGLTDKTATCDDTTSNFLKLFIFSLVVGCLSQFISLAIILSVFDYGRQKFTQSFIVKKMSGFNESLLYNFKQMFIVGSALILILTYLIAFSYGIKDLSPEDIHIDLMRKIGCSALSLTLLGIIGYELYLAVEFLKIRQKNAQLYIVT